MKIIDINNCYLEIKLNLFLFKIWHKGIRRLMLLVELKGGEDWLYKKDETYNHSSRMLDTPFGYILLHLCR